QNLMARLSQAVDNIFPLSVSGLTAPVLALTALTGAGLGTFRLADGLRQVAEVTAQDLTHLVGQSIADVSARYRLTVLTHMTSGHPDRFLLEVEEKATLAPGDRLVVCGRPEDLQPLLAEVGDDLLPHLRWAGWLRRHWRILVRTVRDIDWPVQVATA